MKAIHQLLQKVFSPKKRDRLNKNQPYRYPSLKDELTKAGLTFDRWLKKSIEKQRIYGVTDDDVLERVKREGIAHVLSTIIAAEHILNHRFQLLGSEPYEPVDPDRPPRPNGYKPIDWALDPIKGERFLNNVPYKEWNLYQMRPKNADIKLPWELARCQHWVALGQAYRLTKDDRYAIEVANEIEDFLEANPIGIGINWTCTMDVAIRAANWAIAFDLIQSCQELSEAFWQTAYDALFGHGVFIYENLENTYEVTSNHFLSNVVGLYFLAAVFSETSQGEVWDRFCRDSLEKEMTVQVYDEGADFESSLPYHRLVTELFLGAARVAELQEHLLSSAYYEKLRKMVQYSISTMRPDGLMPQIGDADDGRLHIFTDYARWNPQDPRHLFGPASFLLNEPAWLDYAGSNGAWEAVWWGYDCPIKFGRPAPLPSTAQLFPESGLAAVRNGGHFLLITNGVVGTEGFGNHKHNELLSFECCLDGVPLIVDPGSFVYTSDFDARNRFRSTAYHNTLRVDAVEQNEMQPETIFRLFEKAEPEHLQFNETEEWVEYRGLHKGYQRLESPVIHERCFRFRKDDGLLLIQDIVRGKDEHLLEWHFSMDPAIQISDEGKGRFLLKQSHRKFLLQAPSNLKTVISEAEYSPSYGVKIQCQALDLSCRAKLEDRTVFAFSLRPNRVEEEEVERILTHWLTDNE